MRDLESSTISAGNLINLFSKLLDFRKNPCKNFETNIIYHIYSCKLLNSLLFLVAETYRKTFSGYDLIDVKKMKLERYFNNP